MSASSEANAQYKRWDTYRSKCGGARLTYHPEWSESQPWVSYIYGTAGRHFAFLSDGVSFMRGNGFTFYTERSTDKTNTSIT